MADRERLIELIDNYPCMSTAKDCFMESISSDFADYLLATGNIVVLPCEVGDTIYRIDIKPKKCSQFGVYTSDEYYCANELNCYLYGTPACNCGEEAYIFTIPNADIKAIVCNMDKLGKTVFLTKEEAEKAIAERIGK